MSSEEIERDLIGRADAFLTDRYGVVLDDVVLRAWGNGRAALVHRLLRSAIDASGGDAEAGDLWPIATAIAFPEGDNPPWLFGDAAVRGERPGSASPVRSARLLAGALLADLVDGGRRWRHTQAAAARAEEAADLFEPAEATVLRTAAWLHDVGYAPALNRTGFHLVDGATHVDEQLSTRQVGGLVAHHSGARFIAGVRGLGLLMVPFARPECWASPLADALTWADQTTGPEGERVTVEERLQETLARHGPDSPNARSHPQRAAAVIGAARRTEERLQAMHRLPAGQKRSTES